MQGLDSSKELVAKNEMANEGLVSKPTHHQE
jgi:hypothetical protein